MIQQREEIDTLDIPLGRSLGEYDPSRDIVDRLHQVSGAIPAHLTVYEKLPVLLRGAKMTSHRASGLCHPYAALNVNDATVQATLDICLDQLDVIRQEQARKQESMTQEGLSR